MKKVGILTLNGYHNYGNRLQNYAVQYAIEQLNFECETIINSTYIVKNTDNKDENNNRIIDRVKIFLKKDLSGKLEIINYKINRKNMKRLYEDRTKIFMKFSNKYIHETKFSISADNIIKDINNKYEYFISGSDQVWNPYYPSLSEINFMTFSPKDKRLTYAPSFGVSIIPEQYKEDYKNWLEGIDNISVREEDGASIVKELTGKDAIVVVDPTMLLTKESWLSISKAHDNKPKKKYLLTYFLGEVSKEVNKKIKKIAKTNKLEVVNLATVKNKKYYVTGPSEFIDYINDAELFMTDSFHACVFSVLLETPFIVCDREGQGENKINSRIETFLGKFKLQSRKFNKVTEESIFEKNYIEANKVLEKERKKSWDYLEKVLKVEDKSKDC